LKLHILDGLDYLNDEKNIMKDDTRSGLLREYVQELKGMLPNSHDKAWNHLDDSFVSVGGLQFERNLKAWWK
jgi:hypothetical protein